MLVLRVEIGLNFIPTLGREFEVKVPDIIFMVKSFF